MSSENEEVGIRKLMIALLAACIAYQLNCSMLSPVLVKIAIELHTSDTAVGLSQTLFFTSAALFSLFFPRLSDIVGRKKIMILMLSVMIGGTVISALSVNVEMLYIGRIVQGVCGPIIAVCLMMIRTKVADPKKFGLLMGIITAVNGGVAGIDAILGGVLAEQFGFRSAFWCIAFVTALSMFLILRFSEETRPSPNVKMDWTGSLLLVISIGALLPALNEASRMAAASWSYIITLLCVGAVAFIGFLITEKKVSDPLVSVAYLRRRSTWSLLLTTMLTLCGVYAVINGLVMSYVQNHEVGFGLTADWTGFALLTPYALAGWFIGPFSGRFAPVIGFANVLRFGLLGIAVSIGIISYWGVHCLPVLIVAVFTTGVAYAGMANIMLNALGIVLSPDDNPGFLPGLNAGAFNLGAGLSFAILPAIQFIAQKGGPSSITGYQVGMNAGLVITLMALLSSFLIPRPVAAELSDVKHFVLE